jgi:integrase
MYQRKDGMWADTVKLPGMKRPKFFYGQTKAEVKKKMAAYSTAYEKGQTISTALDSWLAVKEKTVAYKTYEGYKAPIERIKAALGDEHCKELQPAQIQAFINSIAAQGYKRTAVQRPLDILRMLFDWLITSENTGVTFNPCTAVKLPGGLKQERRNIAARDDVEKIKAGLALDFGLFAYLLLYTGLRKGEALALTYNDFDFNAMEIRVNKAVSWQPNKPVIKEPKTAAGVRSVPILTPLANALPKKWTGYLFSSDGGKTPLTQQEYRLRWDGYCKAAGLCDIRVEEHKSKGENNRTYKKTIYTPRIVPHQLRHEFATLCLDAGLDAADTQEIMGHASITTTQQTYQHITNSRRKKSTSKLDKFVTEA